LEDKGAYIHWTDFLKFPIAGRSVKPRTAGLTMVIDKGMGLTQIRELLEMASEFIDLIKLGFGTSALYSTPLLRRKIDLVRSYKVDIYPGGTFLEVAVLQGKLKEYLKFCRELGFSAVEISDGTINMKYEERKDAIKRAADLGFIVLSEVGKKDVRHQLDAENLAQLIEEDLLEGAFKVIIEGRESGRGVVLYDNKGNIKEEFINTLLLRVRDLNSIIWEAPLKSQQQEFITRFGPNVNLGNIKPDEVIALEALRVGLRGDTLRLCVD